MIRIVPLSNPFILILRDPDKYYAVSPDDTNEDHMELTRSSLFPIPIADRGTTEGKVKLSKMRISPGQTPAFLNVIATAHGVGWLCSPAKYGRETMNQLESDGRSTTEALTSSPHTTLIDVDVVDGEIKGPFNIRYVPAIEREGEGSERPPKSNPDIDHETRQ